MENRYQQCIILDIRYIYPCTEYPNWHSSQKQKIEEGTTL